MTKYVVTGASGYIGSSIVKSLVAQGDSVLCVFRESSDKAQLGAIEKKIGICIYGGNSESLKSAFLAFEPSIIIHVASCFIAEHKPQDIDNLINSNVLFGTHLLEAMSYCQVNKLINVGTSWQHYGNSDYDPVCLYAATKQAFVDILKYYVNARRISCITLKLFDTYGMNDPRKKLVHLLAQISESGEELAMSEGQQQLDLVHIDDVVQAFKVASRRIRDIASGVYEEFAISTQKPMSLREVVSRYESYTGKRLNIKWGGRSYRGREVMTVWTKFELLDGWRAKNIFPEGLY